MKNIRALFLVKKLSAALTAAVTLLLLMSATTARAQFGYSTNLDGVSVTITNYTGGNTVVIPAHISGLTVTVIGSNAFAGKNIGSVVIPDSVTDIQFAAFSSCSNLTNVVFGSGVTNIGTAAFEYDYEIKSISLPAGLLTIQDYAFANCNQFPFLAVPDSVLSIGANAFSGCSSVETATIGIGVTNIGDFAFESMNSLHSITFNGDAPTVGTNIFEGTDASVYFHLSRTGWSSTFGGLPAYPITTLNTVHVFDIFPSGNAPTGPLVQGSNGVFYGTAAFGGQLGYGALFSLTTNGVLHDIYTFTNGIDGAEPLGGLVFGNDGSLYGTAFQGGTNSEGTIYKITTNGVFTLLHSFSGEEGANPAAALLLGHDGNFYGTAENGAGDYGSVFQITSAGGYSNVYAFQGNLSGAFPTSPVVQDAGGNFYGTTPAGGSNDYGVVYKIDAGGNFSTLHLFQDTDDGAYPYGGVTLGADGHLYGVASYSGIGYIGVVFQVATDGSSFNTIYSLDGNNTGSAPVSRLVQGPNGSLYGTTLSAGSGGFGTIFNVTTNGDFNVLYAFHDDTNGANPYGGLVFGRDGRLYGTTYGENNGALSPGSLPVFSTNATAFAITTNGSFTRLASFQVTQDGQYPISLIHGSDGNFYGAVYQGGSEGVGTIFKLNTNGIFTLIYTFTNGPDGANPTGLVEGPDGNLYGCTDGDGGDYGPGTIFRISKSGTLSTLHYFDGDDGFAPEASLAVGNDGNLYGSTAAGGIYEDGTLFKITLNGKLTTLHNFNTNEGISPIAPLLLASDGNFYGTTEYDADNGSGSIFQLAPDGDVNILYSFDSYTTTTSAPLVEGTDGKLYGVVEEGDDDGDYEDGYIFKITKNGCFNVIYVFEDDFDGYSPSSLLAGADGNLYGTTSGYDGSLFRVSPDGTFFTLYWFQGHYDGANPSTQLVQGADGTLYGANSQYSSGNQGTLFQLTTDGLPSPLPMITAQPEDSTNILTGLPTGFEVTGAVSPLSYRWLHNGVPITPTEDFDGIHSPILNVIAAAPYDAGTYSVIVSNSYGSVVSSNVSLTLLDDTNRMDYYDAGTNYLTAGDYYLAMLSFSNALSFAPTNAKLNFLYASSELMSLMQEPAGSNFLTRLGFGGSGRDFFNWLATESTDANGHWTVPSENPPLNVDEFTAELRTNVLPRIIDAEAHLASITNTNCVITLTTNETHGACVKVDWGDVQMLQSMGDALQLFIYTTYSWNLNVQLNQATNYFGKDGSFEAFLTNYPSFLTTTTTADLSAAQIAFVAGATNYFAASEFIRSRPEETRLFNLGASEAKLECEFRQTLSNLLASLNGPVPLTTDPHYTVNMQEFFGGQFNLRSYLPEFDGEQIVSDSFPDPTLGGMIFGLDQNALGHFFYKHHIPSVLDLPNTMETVVYNFTNYDAPSGLVQGTDGTLYGTMTYGGPYTDSDPNEWGFGCIFKITTDGQFSVLYNFGTSNIDVDDDFIPLDGGYPNGLTFANDGNLYGTTQIGGRSSGTGTVFRISTNGVLTNIYVFNNNEGTPHWPGGPLVQGADGLLWGTTLAGGNQEWGTIFSISTSGNLSNRYSFDYSDGVHPSSALVQTTNGIFYGTTSSGGNGVEVSVGTVFKFNPSAFSNAFSVVYTFDSLHDTNYNPADGAMPNGLTLGSDGSIYGTTTFGGAANDNLSYADEYDFDGTSTNYGNGTLFRIDPNNGDSFLHVQTFSRTYPSGFNPIGTMVRGPNNLFYGMTANGGANQHGSVFAWKPGSLITNVVWLAKNSGAFGENFPDYCAYYQENGDYEILGNFLQGPSLLTAGSDGYLYAVTTDYGAHGAGAVNKLNLSGAFILAVSLDTPANGQSFTAPATITLTSTVDYGTTNASITYYDGAAMLGSASTPPYTFVVSNVAAGEHTYSAVVTDTNGTATSATSYITVNNPGSSLIDFDPLDTSGNTIVSGAPVVNYLNQYSISVLTNSPGTIVAVENQNGVGGGHVVAASSAPNVLTQLGSNGPVSFTIGFGGFLSQFSFTRPQLLAQPSVSHPAWRAVAYDALGTELSEVSEAQIFSTTNVPASTFTLGGGSIAAVEFDSLGSGLTTVNAMLLDDFTIVAGNSGDLPPSIVLTSPANGEVFTTTTVPLAIQTVAGAGSISSVQYYYNGILLTNTASLAAFNWTAPSNGTFVLTAVAFNTHGLSNTSAPVSITVANGFAIVTPPTSQMIAIGSKATFTVSATATNATYQWKVNGANISGATNAALTIQNATKNASGDYTVVVTSGNQSISSPPATLSVIGPPTLGTVSVTTNNTTNIVLSVTASDTIPFYYKWKLNGNGIPGATNNLPAGTNTITYTITNGAVLPYFAGNYRVVVANAVAAQESPKIPVTGGLPPLVSTNNSFDNRLVITNLLGNGAAYAGLTSANSTGPANVAGKPAGGYLWYDWTATFSGVIGITTRGSTFDTLLGIYTGTNADSLVTVGQDDDSGGFFTSLAIFNCTQGTTYHFVVAGYKGATGTAVLALSPGVLLNLPGPPNGYTIGGSEPVITQQPVNQNITEGDNVTLSVIATGATGYQWFFSDVPVAGGTANTLVITNFPASAVGNYYVQVSNAVGIVVSATATIEIAAASTGSSATNLSVDKFGDSTDLSASSGMAQDRLHPLDGGGETGGFTLSQSFNTLAATKEENEPNHAGQPGGASYWYTYTALQDGTVDFNTTGSTFSTILAIYVGPGNSFTTLTNVGAGFTTNYQVNGQPDVVVSNVAARTKFFIAVDGYLGQSGAAKLNISSTPATIVVATNALQITNNTPVVAISSPAANFLSTSSNVLVKGTVKGTPFTYIQLSVNGGSPINASVQSANWSSNVTLVNGANVITAQAVYVASSNALIFSQPVSRTVFYSATPPSSSVKAKLTLLITPSTGGKVSGAANNASLVLNKVYTVKATPGTAFVFDNWSTGTDTNSLAVASSSASFSFLMTSNLIVQATFTNDPFTNFGGNYNGLFSPADGITEASSGFFAATLAAKGKGAYSAKVMVDGGSYPLSGTFDLTGEAQGIVARKGATSLTVDLHLDLTSPANNQMTGTVSEVSTNGFASGLMADRAIFNAKTFPATNLDGKYTVILPPGDLAPTNEPGGASYATVTATTAGAVSISGSLADKTTFSQSVPVSKDGNVPLYVSLYSKKGSVQGWLTLTNDSVFGSGIAWIKPAIAKTVYPAGFTNTNGTASGSLYVAPKGSANNFALTNATLIISNGGLTGGIVFSNVSVVGNKLVQQGTTIGTITAGTGVVSVPFKPAGARSAITAKGVVLQGASGTNGAGWFIGTNNQSGFFLLQP